MLRVAPSWYVLTYLHLLPRLDHVDHVLFPSSFPGHKTRQPPRGMPSHIRISLVSLIYTFLLAIFCHDIFNCLFNKASWLEYMTNKNKIITLLILLKSLTIDWRNCLSFLLFAGKAKDLPVLISDLSNLIKSVKVTERQINRHRWTFVFCYSIPLVLGVCRYGFFTAYLLASDPFQLFPYGLVELPRYIVSLINGVAHALGELLALSVYIQIASYANALVQCCRSVNVQLAELCLSLPAEEKTFRYTTFQERIWQIRGSYEELVRQYHAYERIFSLQIAFGVMNNGLVVFASIASFFKVDPSGYWYLVHTLSCVTYLFIIAVLSLFPIHLREESSRTAELLQVLIYQYQTADQAPATASSSTCSKDYIVLCGFLQRTLSKPLVVSAGGFVELTRSFVISVVAAVIGFTLFLLEQYENEPSVICWPNGTKRI